MWTSQGLNLGPPDYESDKQGVGSFVTPCHHFMAMLFDRKVNDKFGRFKQIHYLCTRKNKGAIAQMVEQRTENPCVPGSIPGGTTLKKSKRE